MSNGKNLIAINAHIDISRLQYVKPNSLSFSGIISVHTANGRLETAHDAIKITNERLTIGIQLNASSSGCEDFIIMYTARVM